MKQNKQLNETETPQIAESQSELTGTLARVDVAVARVTEYEVANDARDEALIEYGRLRESYAHCTLSNFTFVMNLKKLKKSKGFEQLGFASFESFIEKTFHLSLDTVTRRIKEFEQYGPTLGEFRELVDVTISAFRRVNPEFTDDGFVIVAGKRYKVNASNADAIQMAFLEQDRELKRKAEEASSSKAALKKSNEERDNAKKAAQEATRKLREHQATPQPFADVDDEDHRLMLQIQANHDANMLLLLRLTGYPENRPCLLPENEMLLMGLCGHLERTLLQRIDDARFAYGKGENRPDGALTFLENEPDTSRDLIGEYIADRSPR